MTDLDFISFLRKGDREKAALSARPIYFVASLTLTQTIPQYRSEISPLASRVVYDHDGWTLLELDRGRVLASLAQGKEAAPSRL